MSSESSTPTVMIVDDNPVNVRMLVETLRDQYALRVADDGRQAIELVTDQPPDLILLDVMMPGMDGYEVIREIQSKPSLEGIPVIFVTSMDRPEDTVRAFENGAVDYITKPLQPLEIRARVGTHINLRRATLQVQDQNRILEEQVARRTSELVRSRMDIIRILSAAAERKDKETADHVIRVGYTAYRIAREFSCDAHFCESLLLAAPLHDVGKVAIPNEILQKPAPLTAAERRKMQKHTIAGQQILSQSDYHVLAMGAEVALTHHERWDGGGYPHGLAGSDIPLAGRITGIADVYDALISARPYKQAWPPERATAQIRADSGAHFDPLLVEAFVQIQPELSDAAGHNSIHDLLLTAV